MAAAMELTVRNDLSELERVLTAVEEFCDSAGAPPKVAYHFGLAFDELFTNIVSYGYDGTGERAVTLSLWMDSGVLHGRIVDDARPFNPLLEASEPDLDAAVEDRAIGGLGVHFVKRFMDGASYDRVDDRNRLEFWKQLSGPEAASAEE